MLRKSVAINRDGVADEGVAFRSLVRIEIILSIDEYCCVPEIRKLQTFEC